MLQGFSPDFLEKKGGKDSNLHDINTVNFSPSGLRADKD